MIPKKHGYSSKMVGFIMLSMGDLQDPIDGGTVPYFWSYFVGIIP
jgi:hypothetical protein